MTNFPQESSEHSGEMENEFLEGILCHTKCRHFSENDKLQIEKAFGIACRAHATQTRKSKLRNKNENDPYMDHIIEVLWDYLRITKRSFVTANDLIVTVLHDVIEDHPEYAHEIFSEFGDAVFSRIESISKGSPQVVGAITEERMSRLLSPCSSTFSISMFSQMYLRILEIGVMIPTHFELYGYLWSLYPRMQTNLKNYYFLWGIALLSEDDFEIKCADRMSNLKHLTHVDKKYVEKTLHSTKIYIMKAQALGRYDLVRELDVGIESLELKQEEFMRKEALS